MDNLILPWQLVVISLAGWLNRHQQAVIEYNEGVGLRIDRIRVALQVPADAVNGMGIQTLYISLGAVKVPVVAFMVPA